MPRPSVRIIIAVVLATCATVQSTLLPLYRAEETSSECYDFIETVCGDGCIPVGWTCCPGGGGGCGPLENCVRGDNGEYGCCLLSFDCVGDGGAITVTGNPTVPLSIFEPFPTDASLEPSAGLLPKPVPTQKPITSLGGGTGTTPQKTLAFEPIPTATASGGDDRPGEASERRMSLVVLGFALAIALLGM